MNGALPLPDRGALGTHQLSQHSVETREGRRYRLFRAVPTRRDPAGHPVLYLLDGNAAFAGLTPAMLARVPELLVIGIGYETDELFALEERWLDYTPPRDGRGPAPDPQRPEFRSGGAECFLHTLTGELRTSAEADLSVDPGRRSLWGHSFGGLFVLQTLFTRPQSFGGYIPVSPSLWWGDGVMAALERRACACPAPPPSLLVMLGDRESRSDRPKPAVPQPAPATLAMIARLSARRDLRTSARVLQGFGHGAALYGSLPFALAEVTHSNLPTGGNDRPC